MRYSFRSVLLACLAVALLMTTVPYYLEWRHSEIRTRNSRDSVQLIESLGGMVEEFGMSRIPSSFFLLSSENVIVPESIRDIEVTGILTSAHDLQRLPESVERLWLTLTPSAIRNLPRFHFVKSLRIELISEAESVAISNDDAVVLRSKFTKHLSKLSLLGDSLSDDLVHQFRDCRCLETLQVGGKGISGYGFAEWPPQNLLTSFYVEGEIQSENLLQFPALPNATIVEICSATNLSKGLKWLRSCPKISFLTLSGTRVDPMGFQEVIKLRELSTLELRALKNIDFSVLSGISSLCRIELNRCEIRYGNFSTWPLSTSVSELSLRRTEVSLAGLSRIPGLRSVDLDSLLTFEDFVESGLPDSLREFKGDYVDVSNEQLEKLKELYPRVKFLVPDETVNRIPPRTRRDLDLVRKALRE